MRSYLNEKTLKVFIPLLIVFMLDTAAKLFIKLGHMNNTSLLFLDFHICPNTRISDINIAIPISALLVTTVICFAYVDKNIGASFILAGCMTNFIDCMLFGFVIDYLKIEKIIFNLSDLFIIFGLLITIVIYSKTIFKELLHLKSRSVRTKIYNAHIDPDLTV